MIRLIDVDNLIDFLTRPTGQLATCEKCYNTDCVDCIREEVIKNLPIIEAEPVRHGKWLMESDGGTRCSSCKKKVHDVTDGSYAPVDLSKLPYCPKCGAKMDLE